MKIGLIKTSLKENEKRIPLLPMYIEQIDSSIRSDMYFESGYGLDFGYEDKKLTGLGCRILSRSDIFNECDTVILAKPVMEDLVSMKENQVIWGWLHCVQQTAIAQKAIDKKLTLIAWESMFKWSKGGEKLMHIFYRNNEIAGYASVHHALNIYGMDGNYGKKLSVGIIGYGSVSRGAVNGLLTRGYLDIVVYSKRPVGEIKDKQINLTYKQIFTEGNEIFVFDEKGKHTLFIDSLSNHDIICNGVFQDPLNPLMFVNEENMGKIKDNTLIIDISCDENMGFFFAKPTTFENPSFILERNIRYYSVDHTPTFFREAASNEISIALLPYLKVIHGGPEMWSKNETIAKAIEIQDGNIINTAIIEYQNRDKVWPFHILNI
jgi:N5-(carboxyethyl)ornithine synthase